MMNCSRIDELLGPYSDGELAAGDADSVRLHLAECSRCRKEMEALHLLSSQVASYGVATDTAAPREIWLQIERRLDGEGDDRICDTGSLSGRLFRLARRPLALAASLALFIGLGLLFNTFLGRGVPAAHAAVIDYGILMDGVATDVRGAIDRFLSHYEAEPIDRSATRAAAAHLSFDLPEMLPADYQFEQAYRFKLGKSNAVAATYCRGRIPLFLIFHPMSDNVKGPKETSCRIGDLHAGQIEAGSWRLVHVMDQTTCHCVLSTLEDPELAAVVQAVSPSLTTGVAPSVNCH